MFVAWPIVCLMAGSIEMGRAEPWQAQMEHALGEYVLPYDAMRQALSPEAALWEFLQSTYEAAAGCAKWDRAALERH